MSRPVRIRVVLTVELDGQLWADNHAPRGAYYSSDQLRADVRQRVVQELRNSQPGRDGTITVALAGKDGA